jgi:hypothetical protein
MADLDYWIAGFVDGEGCFSLAINSHTSMSLGYQVQAEFAVTQAASSLEALELIKNRLQCGVIQLNTRKDNHHEPLMIYRVRKLDDLIGRVIPFFQTYPLRTAKRLQFELFTQAVLLMREKRHLTPDGFEFVRNLSNQMNQRAKSRNAMKSSETIRQASRK